MQQHKLVISSERATAFAISDLLEQIGEPTFDAISLVNDEADVWNVECYSPEAIDVTALTATISAALELPSGAIAIKRETIPDIDWVSKVQSDLKPVRVGGFMIHGSHDRGAARYHSCAIEIDAGQAFGTAHHGTTAGCLHALDAVLKREAPKTILDLGTGSGVLAIAAAKRLPSATVLGSDIDREAVTVAISNARINRTPNVKFITADGLTHPEIRQTAPFDLVFANILARPLMTMATDIAATTRQGGTIIISGLLTAQARPVGAAFITAGCRLVRREDRGEWATLTLKKHATKKATQTTSGSL